MKAKLTVLEKVVIRIFNIFSPYQMEVLKYPDPSESCLSACLGSTGRGGFGCWYFHVGEDHPMYRTYHHRFSSEYDWDADCPDWYCGGAGDHETTYAKDGWIGFDLWHIWCSPEHDFWYIIREAWKQIPEIYDIANK